MQIYNANETMNRIGHQYFTDAITQDDVNRIKDVLTAYGIANALDVGADLFILGFMAGKRSERRKRNGNTSLQAK